MFTVIGQGMRKTEFVTVGKIVKPFGVRGQVRVLSLTDVPGRLENLKDVMKWLLETQVVKLGLYVMTLFLTMERRCRLYIGLLILKNGDS